jgi:hypothetical protein
MNTQEISSRLIFPRDHSLLLMCGTRCFCLLLSYSVLTIPRRLSIRYSRFIPLSLPYSAEDDLSWPHSHTPFANASLNCSNTVIKKNIINIIQKQFSVDRKWLRSITCIQVNVFPFKTRFKLCQKARNKINEFPETSGKGAQTKVLLLVAPGTHSYIRRLAVCWWPCLVSSIFCTL